MAYVEVDVDLADLETYELAGELIKRLSGSTSKRRRIPLTNKQRIELKETIVELNEELNCVSDRLFPNKTLEDKMKAEVILSVWEKYTSAQLEDKLK